jgi:hypothetical protein
VWRQAVTAAPPTGSPAPGDRPTNSGARRLTSAVPGRRSGAASSLRVSSPPEAAVATGPRRAGRSPFSGKQAEPGFGIGRGGQTRHCRLPDMDVLPMEAAHLERPVDEAGRFVLVSPCRHQKPAPAPSLGAGDRVAHGCVHAHCVIRAIDLSLGHATGYHLARSIGRILAFAACLGHTWVRCRAAGVDQPFLEEKQTERDR